jgi:hypothetical protein
MDAEDAAAEAVKEAEYGTMSRETEAPFNEEMTAARQHGHISGPAGERMDNLEQEGYRDADMAAEEAVKEAEYEMMTKELRDGHSRDVKREGEIAEKVLRSVEIEEVEDEDR